MKLVRPQNFNLNINSIKDNTQNLNKDIDKNINSLITQNCIKISPDINPLQKVFFSITPQTNNINNVYNNSTTQTTKNDQFGQLNIINNNLNEDSSLKENKQPLININNIINDNNNKLIKPILIGEPNNINNCNNVILNNAIINKSKGRIRIRESAKFRKRKIFNKFKVYRIEPKKEKEKILYKLKHKRKYKPDDIRKKIKARFHKSIKNIVNENLRIAGSKHLFSFLPQIFISSISREKNHQVLNISYRDLLKKDFLSNIDEKKYKNKRVDLAKYKNNLKVLEYLDKNPDICEKSGFDIISKMKYGDLLDEYFKSDEFERAIKKLYLDNEEEDYIKEYINKAKSYVKFFSEIPFKINNNKIKKKSDSLAIEIRNNEKEEKK